MRDSDGAKQDERPQAGENADIKKVWDAAARAFQDICGKSLVAGDVKTFDDVKRTIERKSQTSESDDEWAKAKIVGLKSLEYLKVLVGVAAQASSLLPIPSAATDMASHALCFVFNIPLAIKAYIDAVNQVFDEISSTLAQVQIYKSMDNIDPALVHQVHLVMVSFVKLSAHVVKYQEGGTGHRFLHKIKAAFDDDSGLSDEMDTFRKALQQQRDVEGTITLKVAVDTQKDIKLLIERSVVFQKTVDLTHQGVQTLQNSSDRANQLNEIKETFELPSAWNVQLESKTTEDRTRITARCDKGTGEWIWTHESYIQWTTPKEDGSSPQVLFVSGPASSGKSSACALITQRLEQEKDRTYVAHYFFPKKPDTEIKYPAQMALKYMAFQLARVDPTVQKALYNACKAGGSSAFRSSESLESLWEKMKIGGPGSRATYYLVFEGLENLPPPGHAKDLVNFIFGRQVSGDSKSTSRLRVLASGKEETLTLPDTKKALRIKMEEENAQDMRKIIETKLQTQGVLQRSVPKDETARDKILEVLPKKVEGSHSNLQLGLDDIIQLLSKPNAIDELDRKLGKSGAIINREDAINTFQRSLTVNEIDSLNELLKWVVYGREWFSLQTLEAVMSLNLGSDSLVPLSYIIKNKYDAIFKIEDEGGFVDVQDAVSEFLREKSVTPRRPPQSEEQATISMTITIHNVDQETCGNFLWDLALKSNRDKFKFDFDADSANKSQATIQIAADELEAHHTIVLSTFKFLEGECNDQNKILGEYLVNWLPHHLNRLRVLRDEELRDLKKREYQSIGQNLYKLFNDNKIFERHKAILHKTYWDVWELEEIQDWLRDPTVVRGIQDKPWKDRVKNVNSPSRGYLQCFTRMMVESMLKETRYDAVAAFSWVRHLIDADDKVLRTYSEAQPDDTGRASSPTSTYADNIDWDHISKWCQGILGLSDSELDSLWYERLASTVHALGGSGETVLSWYKKALSKDKPSWRCHRGMGDAYFSQEQFTEAMQSMSLALEGAEKEDSVSRPERKDVIELQLCLGEYAEKAGDLQRATECYVKASSSKDTYQARKAQLGHLRTLLSFPDPQQAKAWLRDTLATRDGEEGSQSMVNILKQAATTIDHGSFIWKLFAVASGDQNILSSILRDLETATAQNQAEAGTDEDSRFANNESLGVLFYYRGVASYTNKGSPKDKEHIDESLRLWEACRKELSDVRTYVALVVRNKAAFATAHHYFQDMLTNKHLNSIDALCQLAEAEDELSWGGLSSGFLGALYAHRKEKAQSMEALKPRVNFGIQILSDETPDNDLYGFRQIYAALVQHGDFTNAAIAFLLSVLPDVVADCLSFKAKDIADGARVERGQVLDASLVTELASKTLGIVKSQIPSTARQAKRIQVAKVHVQSCLDAAGPVPAKDDSKELQAEGQEEVTSPDTATVIAYNRILDELIALEKRLTFEMEWNWTCDGRTTNGEKCKNRDVYHCIYCPNRDFCESCLWSLRNPDKSIFDMDIMRCNSKHRWLKLPPPDSSMYAGPLAATLKVPRVQERDQDYQILEIFQDGDEEVKVEEWIKDLAREWGVDLEEKKDGSGGS